MNDFDNAIQEILATFKKLTEVRKNNKECYCYDVFEKWELTNWNTYPQYTWQWNFTEKEYDTIKKLLKKHSSCLSQIIKQNKICCKLLQMYVSEWYKREFNGHDGQGNAFDAIETENLSRQIWEILCDFPADKVYRSNIDENGVETGQREWLSSIYVDGGLPLNYLLSPQRGQRFTQSILNIIEESNNENSDLAAELGELCDNGVVNQSYLGRIVHPDEDEASVFDFIQETIVKENLIIDGFEDFIKKIHAIKKESLKCKFKVKYKLYKTSHYYQLTPQLCLKPDPNGLRYAITDKRLEEWGSTPKGNSFIIKIMCNNIIIWREKFSKCLRGDYISTHRQDYYDLQIDGALLVKPWTVFIDDREIKNTLDNPLQKQGFVQLYSSEGCDWNSVSGNNYKHSAILFDWKRDCDLCQDEKNRISEDIDLGWKPFVDKVEFELNGKKFVRYSRTGELMVSLAKECKHELSQFFDGRDAEGLPLELIKVGMKPIFDVIITKNVNGEIVSSIIDGKKCKWECRKGKTGAFSELKENSIDLPGVWELRVVFKENNKNKTISCFAVPQNAKHKHLVDQRRTDFINFGQLIITHNGSRLTRDNDRQKITWGNATNVFDYHHPETLYTVSDNSGNFNLKLYQPIKATVAKKKSNDEIFAVGRQNDDIRIPILLLNKLDFYRLPDNEKIEIDKFSYLRQAFNALKSHQYNDNNASIDYTKFQTFTHQINWVDNQPTINYHTQFTDKLNFIFVPIHNPYEFKTIPLLANDTCCYFDTSNIKEEGIIVQTIGRYELPEIILKPVFIPTRNDFRGLSEQQRRNKRWDRINSYHNQYVGNKEFKEAVTYFNIAEKTGMYFGCFDALLGLVCQYNTNRDNLILSGDAAECLAGFYKSYCENSETVNNAALRRFADEFVFDWTLIPRDVWKGLFKSDLDVVYALFKNSSIIDSYWTFQINAIPQNENNVNIYLRTIADHYGRGRNAENNASFWRNRDLNVRVSLLRDLQNGSLFENIEKYIINQ